MVIEPTLAPDAAGQSVPGFSMTWTHADKLVERGAVGLGPVSELLRRHQGLGVELKISDAQVFELAAGELKRKLLGSTDAVASAQKGNDPIIITRAWSGVFTFRIQASDKLDAAAAAKVRSDAKELARNRMDVEVDVGGAQAQDGAVLVKLTTPAVFAFEAAAASYVNSSLATKPQDVKLTPLTVPSEEAPHPHASWRRKDIWPRARPPWAMASVSSGFYPNAQLLTQAWQPESARLALSALSEYGPVLTERWDATASRPLTEDALLGFAETFARKAKDAGNQFFVFYYIGHTLPLGAGEVGLVMGTYDPSRSGDPGPAQVVSLRKLYDQLDASGLPFALLLDGCYEDGTFQEYVSGLGFTADPNNDRLDYIGDADVITRELSEYAQGLREFTVAQPHFRTENLVILAAKPGRVASERAHPRWALETVGPLAQKLGWWMELWRLSDSSHSLAKLLQRATEMRQTGEISAAGSISWSDFSRFEQVAGAVYPGPAENLLLPVESVQPDVLADISPDIIVDFAREPTTGTLLLRDGKFRLLMLESGVRSPRVLKPEMLAVLGQTSSSAYVQDEQEHMLFKLGSDLRLIPVLEGSFIDILGTTRGGDELVAIESDSTIDTPDAIWRINDASASKVGQIEASDITDVVAEGGVFYFALPGRGAILKRSGEEESLLASGLSEPTRLALDEHFLYCLSGGGEYLYKIQKDGQTEAVRLEWYLGSHGGTATGRALRLEEDGRLLLASGGALLGLDPRRLAWRSL
ncbi:hypothetical protein [Pyxidicoccus xibeiensis]|uniref:hypothetical protein n=1 Tax=Pyxidicoccus xibeiensis TaxID=2906759 RepID=UPI0020A7DC99|nr:hypothetical protein [Pyxidicoccus xibeiensis]MCP3142651.1 hypothetical protein [Pyxidicoccus xibeiensis]